MTSSTHFLSLCCLQLNVSYYHGCLVSPWLPPGCQAFSYPRIDGLSRKRGSTGAEEEKNYFRDSLSFCFFLMFYSWKVLTECLFNGSLNIRGRPSVLLFMSPSFLLNSCFHLLSSPLISPPLLRLPHAAGPLPSCQVSSLSSPLPLWQVGCSRDIPFYPPCFAFISSLLLQDGPTVGNTWEHLLSVTFPLSSRPNFLPSHPPHPPIIILLLLLHSNRSLHLPPFLTFTPSTFPPRS